MRGYDSRMLASGVSRHTVKERPTPTMAEIEAQVWRVHLKPSSGMQAVHHVMAFDEAHAIEIAKARECCADDIPTTARLAPVFGLDEAETKAALMAGETKAEREDRRQRYATRIGSVL